MNRRSFLKGGLGTAFAWIYGSAAAVATPVAAGPWDPTMLPGLQLWLDGADRATVTLDKGVSEWRDKSGNSRGVTQPDPARRPTYLPNVIAGKSALHFDGRTQMLSRLDVNLGMSAGLTLFAVFNAVSFNPYNRLFSWAPAYTMSDEADVNIKGGFAVQGAHTGDRMRNFRDRTIQPANVPAMVNTTSIATSVLDNSNDSLSLGQNHASTSSSGPVADHGWLGIGDLARPGLPDGPWNGLIAEIVLYNRALSSGEQAVVTSHLGVKWGLPSG